MATVLRSSYSLQLEYMSPSSAAVYIVPGSLGCGSAVLAAMTILAPSLAALRAIALPIPRLAPVMNRVQPASFLTEIERDKP